MSQAEINPTNTISDIKFMLGRKFSDPEVQARSKKWAFKIVDGGKGKLLVEVTLKGKKVRYSAEDLAGMVLKDLTTLAAKFIGEEVKYAVLTVPAFFTAEATKALTEASTKIGLKVLRLIKEPTAAAMAYGLDDPAVAKPGSQNVLIYDFGGGTCDASLLRVDAGGVMTLVAHAEDTNLGGAEFDQRLVDFFKQTFERKNKCKVEGKESARVLAKLKQACNKVKSSLSSGPQASIQLDSLMDGHDLYESVSRARFEASASDLISGSLKPVVQVLAAAGMEASQVDQVLLVGGSSRIPKVKEEVKKFMGAVPCLDSENPNEALAYGAAVQAGLLGPHAASAELDKEPKLLLSSATLGVGVAGGLVYPVIPSKTSLPCSRTITTSTSADNQTSVLLTLCQGERVKVADNDVVGTFVLDGIAKAGRGVPQIVVKFELDKEGALTVSATDASNKKNASLEVTKGSKAGSSTVDAAAAKKDKAYLAQVAALRDLRVRVEELGADIKSGKAPKDAIGAWGSVRKWLQTAEAAKEAPAFGLTIAKRAELDLACAEEESEDDDEETDDEDDESEGSDSGSESEDMD